MKVENGLITISRLEIKNTFDGGVQVSTGVDSGDGNTRGDGRNPSKFSKCKRKQLRISRLKAA